MARYLFFAATISLCLTGCPEWHKLSSTGVQAAINTNNASVDALNAIQDSVKKTRAVVFKKIAESASSREEGLQELDAAEEDFKKVFVVFKEAETVQNTLADALEAAKQAVTMGEDPNLPNLMKLYVEVQELYNGVLSALAEVR
jgi:hypothetical protein